MELRRPRLADKETVLEMMAEFEQSLRQGLQVAKGKNIKRALVTCSTENPASRAVIVANGGVFEDVRNGVERYWIDLE